MYPLAAALGRLSRTKENPMNIRRSIATVGAAGALAAGSLFLASPAQAGPLIVLPTGGALVDVTIIDFADVNVEDVVVQLPIAVAANVCDLTVAALTGVVVDGVSDCTATATSDANA